MKSAALDQILDEVFSVDGIGRFKTDPATYDMVTAAWKLYPDAVSFQSSNRWDIAGATKFGFRTVWINRSEQPNEYADLQPSLILPSLEGLLTCRLTTPMLRKCNVSPAVTASPFFAHPDARFGTTYRPRHLWGGDIGRHGGHPRSIEHQKKASCQNRFPISPGDGFLGSLPPVPLRLPCRPVRRSAQMSATITRLSRFRRRMSMRRTATMRRCTDLYMTRATRFRPCRSRRSTAGFCGRWFPIRPANVPARSSSIPRRISSIW